MRLKKIEENNLRKAEGIINMPGKPEPLPPGGGGTPLQEANRDLPLDGLAFSRLE